MNIMKYIWQSLEMSRRLFDYVFFFLSEEVVELDMAKNDDSENGM